jgi:hypothetical protein
MDPREDIRRRLEQLVNVTIPEDDLDEIAERVRLQHEMAVLLRSLPLEQEEPFSPEVP